MKVCEYCGKEHIGTVELIVHTISSFSFCSLACLRFWLEKEKK